MVPKKFPEWESVMNMWGGKMLDAITDLVEIVALGLGLEKNALVDRIKNGPHLLAPTGSNFNVFNQLNDVLAAYHYGKISTLRRIYIVPVGGIHGISWNNVKQT